MKVIVDTRAGYNQPFKEGATIIPVHFITFKKDDEKRR